jgi:predicted nucleotidyltransferase
MYPTPYLELNHVLDQLVSRIQSVLGECFIGAYLQGSFAVGDFDQHSDVDFIVAIQEDLETVQVEALQIMHDKVYLLESPWAQHLDGSYFPKEILRDGSKQGIKLWYLDNGARSLIQSDHCNTLLVRWVVREKGVTLAGPPPKTLVDPISTGSLRAEIFETINNWGGEILEEPDRFNNRFYQSFIVLSYCRMLHDLIRGYAGSKQEGAEWAKTTLDPAWIDLIDRTWDGRPDPAQKIREPADPQDYARTLKFVEYIMEESRSYFSKIEPG